MHVPVTEKRTLEQLRQHYEVERELSDRLRAANKEERRTLYSEVYDELYKRVPLHPQLTVKQSPESFEKNYSGQMEMVERFLTDKTVFLEVGPGDCNFAKMVAKKVAQVIAVDVSAEITRQADLPANMKIVISDGSTIPVEPGTANVAYSNQLMEHLHPDDAEDQLRNIYTALAPGGVYVCVTPSRLTGPHDISMVFDREAKGFHLKEYTVGELRALFRRVGFKKVQIIFGGRGKHVLLPTWPAVLCEKAVSILPPALRQMVSMKPPFRWLFGARMVGWK